jgi:hypothetical protein
MPNPNLYKSEKEFMQDCMHTTLHKEKKNRDQGIAQCLNMWKNRKKKMAMRIAEKSIIAKMNLQELYKLEREFLEYNRTKSGKRGVETLKKIIEEIDDVTIELIKEEKGSAAKAKIFRELVEYGITTTAYVLKWLDDPEKTKREIENWKIERGDPSPPLRPTYSNMTEDNVISRLPAPQYSKDRLEELLKYCQNRLEREGKPSNTDTLEKTILLIKEDLKNQKTSSNILTCPDCGYDLDNTKGMDPTKNLIKCPQCGEFMYEKL